MASKLKCSKYFDEIIKKYEDTIELNIIQKYAKINVIISKFIIDNNLILYGGTALDFHLPTNDKIYKKDALFDYDVYSNKALIHGKELVNILVKLNFKYVQLREAAFTRSTYKIFIEDIPIFDITELNNADYTKYLYLSQTINKFKVIPKEILIKHLCMQLSQPHVSYFRLNKIYERYKIFDKLFGINKIDNIQKIIKIYPPDNIHIILEDILLFCKKTKSPLNGAYALNILKDIKNNKFEIMDENMSYLSCVLNNTNDLINYLKKYKISLILEYGTNCIRIKVDNHYICDIYNSSDLCLSYCNKNGYTILTAFSMKHFLYLEYIDSIYKNQSKYKLNLMHNIYNINKFINKKVCTDECLINMDCYGNSLTPKWDIIKSRWNFGILKYKPKITSDMNTYFNDKKSNKTLNMNTFFNDIK